MRISKPTKSSKIRLTIEVNEVDRELFSVVERKSGDVMIFVKAAVDVSPGEGAEFQEVKEQRFSVHVSPKSPGHTVKQTLRTARGQITTSALVMPRSLTARSAGGIILKPKSQFCWPIFMVRPPSLENERYLSKPKPADRRISIGSFSPKLANLVYMVIVTSPDILDIPITRDRTNLQTLPFSRFNVHVMHGFSIAPTVGVGDFVTFATSQQRADGDIPVASRPAISMGLPAVEARFFEGFSLFRDRHGKRFLAEPKDLSLGSEAVTMWGLSAICVRNAPTSGLETMRFFEEYMREVDAFRASNPAAKRRHDSSLDWLYARLDRAKT